jgi:hypothetical protein
MPTRIRLSLATGLSLIMCCALAIGCWSMVDWRRFVPTNRWDAPTASEIRSLPITISMGQFGNNPPWTLSVNSAGEAQLTVDSYSGPATQEFQVSNAQLDELRELLIGERFFALGDSYGELVPDGGTDLLTVVVGGYAKTVRLLFLMNWVYSDQKKLREPARAVRVWMLIRGWFTHSDVQDTRKYDQMVLNAVAQLDKRP